MPHILLIEDSTDVSNLVASELRALAFDVTTALDGNVGWLLLEEREPDLLILDVMLPGVNGFEMLRRLRGRGFDKPILLLTARGEEADRVVGLELGADDYMVKPFSLRELTARVAALLRRHRRAEVKTREPVSEKTSATLRVLDCELDPTASWLKVNGTDCKLSRREFLLLELLMRTPGRVLTREWLLEQVYGRDYSGEDRAVDACVMRLRERLGRASAISRALESVRGLGYRLRASSD
jgi:DNA-binding response OmpR family regulator